MDGLAFASSMKFTPSVFCLIQAETVWLANRCLATMVGSVGRESVSVLGAEAVWR